MSPTESPSPYPRTPYVPMSPEAFQEEVERRANTFFIRFRSLHVFSRIVNLLASLSLAPFFLVVPLLVLGFAALVVIAVTSSGFAGAVLDRHAYWFMPLWYTTWHLFFVLVCATAIMLLIIIPPILVLASWFAWRIPQYFFWAAFLPGRSWAITEETLKAQAKDEIDGAAVRLCLQRAEESRPSRPVFARLLYIGIMGAYFLGTYWHFYDKVNNTTGQYFCWGLNSFHTADIKREPAR